MAIPSMTTDGVRMLPPGTQRASSPSARMLGEHADDVAGERDLAHRRRELAVLDEDAADAHGELAGDRVGAGVDADGVGDQHAALHAGDDVVERRRRPVDDEVGGPHAGQARVAAAQAVAGAGAAGLARRVRVVEEALEHAAGDERRAPGRARPRRRTARCRARPRACRRRRARGARRPRARPHGRRTASGSSARRRRSARS